MTSRDDELAGRFEQHRARLRSLAYRTLGSLADAEDAVQETWLRLQHTDPAEVRELPAWLTTVASRICLDLLRSRAARREEPLAVRVPDPIVTVDGDDPEQRALLTDEVGLALLVVLETLTPAERVAFVLHDLFAVPFTEVADIVGRSPDAVRQLASRARRRVRTVPAPDPDPARQRDVVAAFIAAAGSGDFAALVAVLDPDVVLRADAGAGPLGPSRVVRGAQAVARQAAEYTRLARFARPVSVNGGPGVVAAPGGTVLAVLAVHVANGRVAALTILADPDRLRRLDIRFA